MLKRLRIWQKFTLIAVAFSVPIVVLLFLLVREHNRDIRHAQGELRGVEYLRPVQRLLTSVWVHRDLHAAILAGDSSYKPQLDKAQATVEADLRLVESMDQQHANLAVTDEVVKVRQLWAALRDAAPSMPPEQSQEQHTKLIRQVLRLSYVVGNASALILDPEVDSYYTMDALIFKLPRLGESISEARGVGATLYASSASPDAVANKKGQLAALYVSAKDALEAEREFLLFALEANAEVDQALRPIVTKSITETLDFLRVLDEKIINATPPGITAPEYWEISTKVLEAQQGVWHATADTLQRLLEDRIANLNNYRILSLAAVAVALALTILLLTVVVRAITRPVTHLSQVADRISLGEMDARIEVDTKDEIGELAERFRRMQVSLKAAMDALESQGDQMGTG